ncbi:MAG: hypothetical protein JRJ85_28480 [Deltaproteobacteria bacterium]|nr:hypothetical protein [Deltaproteobacteria bacterium]
MARIYDNLEIATVDGKEIYKCLKCSHILGPITGDYKDFALKNEAPLTKCQPAFIASTTGRFVLREYYCPACGLMFEVDMVAGEEKQIRSVELKYIF